jgi:hypothetical protein
MKMVPIIYRQIFSSRTYCDDENTQGFTPYQDGNRYVIAIAVELEPSKWDSGYFLNIKVFEEVSFPNTFAQKVLVHTADFWDYDNNGPKMSASQSLLIGALYRGDIHGKYGQEVMSALFIELCIKNKSSSIRQYLPEIVSFYEGLNKV